MENRAGNDTFSLGGRNFKKTKNGLDEQQVSSFVTELITERDTLLKYQENLSSLTKLAERTINKADEIAQQAKQEAMEQAKVEAEALITEAREQASKTIEDSKAEAVAVANAEAEAIKAEATKQAASLLDEKAQAIHTELETEAQHLFQEFRSHLDTMKHQVDEFEANFARRLSDFASESPAPDVETEPKAEVEPNDEAEAKAEAEPKNEAGAETEAKDSEPETPPAQNAEAEAVPEWEIRVLPPLDVMQTLQIVNYLDNLPEVKNTELIPQADQALIMVFLESPTDIIDRLRSLPEVGDVIESPPNGSDKPRKIQIALAAKASSRPRGNT